MRPTAGDYELDVSARGAALVVSLRGRITAEARRHLNDVVRAAEKCGVPVELTMPGTERRFDARSTSRPG